MATREEALKWAQQAANRTRQPQAIRQALSGEWFFGSLKFYEKRSTQRMIGDEQLKTLRVVRPEGEEENEDGLEEEG